MWRWDNSDPFGGNPPDENPSGLGTFTCNLRLPGQYFDKETNTHYNYFRDYDPAIGRYMESDPLGIEAGLNTYAYVTSNPVQVIDPYGLKGCGSGFWDPVTPNNPGFSFKGCCDVHDDCYEDCQRSPTKFECDFRFWSCLMNKCGRYQGGVKTLCESVATKYAGLGSNPGQSQNAFNDSRKKCPSCKK